MFCHKCGKEINDDAVVCIHCGCSTEKNNASVPVAPAVGNYNTGIQKCPHCGYEGKMKPGPILRKKDWLIGALTFFFGFGIIYLIIMAIVRMDESSREKTCPNCGAELGK